MQKGFTLLELMIVVAIIGVLAAIAVPQYQDYAARAKLSRVAAAVDPLKLAVASFYHDNGGLSSLTLNNWTSLGLGSGPTPTNEISTYSVAAGTGAITVTLQNVKSGINGSTLTWNPSTGGTTAITWTITSSLGNPPSDSMLAGVISKWQ